MIGENMYLDFEPRMINKYVIGGRNYVLIRLSDEKPKTFILKFKEAFQTAIAVFRS